MQVNFDGLNICEEGRKYLKNKKNLRYIWNNCQRGDWMVYIINNIIYNVLSQKSRDKEYRINTWYYWLTVLTEASMNITSYSSYMSLQSHSQEEGTPFYLLSNELTKEKKELNRQLAKDIRKQLNYARLKNALYELGFIKE